MTKPSPKDVTVLLREWRSGDKHALDKLMPLVYDEMRRIAHRYMQNEREGHTLQTTALINEAYVRLVGRQKIEWQNRAHFYAVTAQVMRQVLIDHARRLHMAKRGGSAQRVTLDEAVTMSVERAEELLALDEALVELARLDPRKGRVVELRYFGGLSMEDSADVLGISLMTVRRDWRAAKAWLFQRMRERDK